MADSGPVPISVSAPVSLLSAQALTVRRAGRTILDAVDLTVGRGEIVTIVGPNGAGKTTLVKVLLGLEAPDGGVVRRDPALRIGYVPQRFHSEALLPMTVRRLLTLGHRAEGPALVQALEEVGVPHLLKAQTQTLSGGEVQRVLLARALLRRPDLLILDEPAQGVDFRGQLDLYDLIASLRTRHGVGVLMISHDLHVVMAATDRVICLHHHVCCVGHPETVAQDPAYLRLFGRDAVGHVAVYSHHHHHAHAPDGQVRPDPVSCGHDHHHTSSHDAHYPPPDPSEGPARDGL